MIDAYTHFGQPAVYYPRLAKVAETMRATVLLSQIIHALDEAVDSWVYISQASLKRIGLSGGELDDARRELIEKMLVDERLMGSPPVRHWRPNLAGIEEALRSIMIVESESPQKALLYAGPTPEKKTTKRAGVVLVDDKARERLITEFSGKLGTGEIESQIDLALAHRAADNYSNKVIYVRRWLQREVDAGSAKRAAPWGRKLAPPGGPSGPAGGSQNGSGESRYQNWTPQ